MNILIVSMDGLDKELIQRYDCKNIIQEEFGTIDNNTGICVRVTTELYTSFLTGKTWRKHGVVGLDRYVDDRLNKIETLNRYNFFRKFKGIRDSFYRNLPFLNARKRHVCYEDYPQDTIFEKIPNSKAIGVRGYSKGYTEELMMVLKEFGIEEARTEMDRWEKSKRDELLRTIEKEDHNLLMAHFHRPDYIHHWYWEVGDEETVKETYEYMDYLAAKIKQKAMSNHYDCIIFLSDHGLPTPKEGAHNKNAFYSCNKKLFGEETPHITDFYYRVLELGDKEEISDIEF